MTTRDARAADELAAMVEAFAPQPGEPAWLGQLRAKAREAFAERGLPTTRDEEWKYTDASFAARFGFERASGPAPTRREIEAHFLPEAAASRVVLVDGRFAPELSSVEGLPRGASLGDLVACADLAEVRETLGSLVLLEERPFGALNTALHAGGAVLVVPPGRSFEPTVQILHVASDAGRASASHPRVLVVAGAGSTARLVETFVSAGSGVTFTNAVAEVVVHRDAVVEHYRVQSEARSAYHVGSTDVRVEAGASYEAVSIAAGATLARHDLRVTLAEERASCSIDGLYLVDASQHCDNHTVIDHAVPHCSSSQLYKGVLHDDGRAVFNGKVIVRPGALETEAHQTNRNLLLSGGARVDTKPELEIFADDVVCTHGATVGSLDDEERFYLASRGLDEQTARGLLTYGFAEEIIAEIKTGSLGRRLDELILARFRAGADRR